VLMFESSGMTLSISRQLLSFLIIRSVC
jgi:hypothetical protein